jgi:hypothetical protein
MAYCQYYVGRKATCNSLEFHYYTSGYQGAIQNDGSIYIYNLPSTLRKLTSEGTPYPGFGNNGLINNVLPNAGLISINNQNIFLVSNNKIAKYDLNGNPDLSFGINGIFTSSDLIVKIFANPDSSLFYISDDKIRKLSSNGQIDNSFEINVHSYGSTVAEFFVIGNNMYVYDSNASSSTINNRFIKKYDLNGVQDMTYGNSGSLHFPNTPKFDMTSGEIYQSVSAGIQKYTSTGVLDNSFGIGGIASVDNGLGFGKVVIDSNNNILFFGGISDLQNNVTRIFRLKHNGDMDNTFNNGSYRYVGNEGAISQVRLIDDNTYVTLGDKTYSIPISSYRFYRNNKFVRTLNQSDITLSTQEINTKKDNLQIYPNPAIDFITIKKSDTEKISKVNIFAMTGELVISGSETKIDIRNLPAGNYILEAKSEKNKYIGKFIKK